LIKLIIWSYVWSSADMELSGESRDPHRSFGQS
jgi:hypothetical protein